MADSPGPCTGHTGPLFCHNGGPVPVDPYPTEDGTYIPAVYVEDGEPVAVVWVNAEGGARAAQSVMQKKKPPPKRNRKPRP